MANQIRFLEKVLIPVGFEKVICSWSRHFSLLFSFTLYGLSKAYNLQIDKSTASSFLFVIIYIIFCVFSIFSLKPLLSLPSSRSDLHHLAQNRWPANRFVRKVRIPEDAFFVGYVLDNTLALAPAWVVLLCSGASAIEFLASGLYFVMVQVQVAAFFETLDHTNFHNRLFAASPGSDQYHRRILDLIEIYTSSILAFLALRIPYLYKYQHLYIHHVENNGPLDNQTTLYYDRESFFDFCRGAFFGVISNLTAVDVLFYLRGRHRSRQIRGVLKGMVLGGSYLFLIYLCNAPAIFFIFLAKSVLGVLSESGIFYGMELLTSGIWTSSPNRHATRQAIRITAIS